MRHTFLYLLILISTSQAQYVPFYRSSDTTVTPLGRLYIQTEGIVPLKLLNDSTLQFWNGAAYKSVSGASSVIGDTLHFLYPLQVSGTGTNDTASVDTTGANGIATKNFVRTTAGGVPSFSSVGGDTTLLLTTEDSLFTNTATAIPGFVVPTQANAVYQFTANFTCGDDTSGVAGPVFKWTLASGTPDSFYVGASQECLFGAGSSIFQATAITGYVGAYSVSAVGIVMFHIWGFIKNGASASGNFQWLWSQSNAGATPYKAIRIYPGSSIHLVRIR